MSPDRSRIRGNYISMNVFIVDDSKILCARLRAMISGIEGVAVLECVHSVSGAIASLRKFADGNGSLDVMILDMWLSDGNGVTVLREARKFSPRTVIVVLTNYPDEQCRRICEIEGADFFLDKSMEFEGVRMILRQMSDNRGGAMHG